MMCILLLLWSFQLILKHIFHISPFTGKRIFWPSCLSWNKTHDGFVLVLKLDTSELEHVRVKKTYVSLTFIVCFYFTPTLHFVRIPRVRHSTLEHAYGYSDTYFRSKACKVFRILPNPTLGHVSILDTFSRVRITQVCLYISFLFILKTNREKGNLLIMIYKGSIICTVK